jgi:hypothetical protein
MTSHELALPDHSIEVNLAKLSVLISRFQASFSQDQRNASDKESIFSKLEAWASHLPQNLRYFVNIDVLYSLQANEAGSVIGHSRMNVVVRTDHLSFI